MANLRKVVIEEHLKGKLTANLMIVEVDVNAILTRTFGRETDLVHAL